jgi:hypothetical protein
MSDKLTGFIEESRKKGVPDEAIKETLVDSGWDKKLVVKSMYDVEAPVPEADFEKSDKLKRQNITLWDTFTHILMFISLAVFAFALGMILHELVDEFVPNPLYDSRYSYGPDISGYLAALIVSTPIFFSLFIYNYNRTRKYAELKNLLTRKILIYLTLIYTFGHILVKLIMTITQLLEGDISMNFMLHFVVTVTINLIIFIYFLFDVIEARKFRHN